MRPNIDISHTLNGQVKDFAAENGLSVEEAYREIIETGLSELQDLDRDVHHDDVGSDDKTDRQQGSFGEETFGPIIDNVGLTGRGALLDERRKEAARILEWMSQQQGEIRKAQAVATCYTEEAGERVDYNEDSWWTELARETLETATEHGLVERYGRKWRWVG